MYCNTLSVAHKKRWTEEMEPIYTFTFLTLGKVTNYLSFSSPLGKLQQNTLVQWPLAHLAQRSWTAPLLHPETLQYCQTPCIWPTLLTLSEKEQFNYVLGEVHTLVAKQK